MYYSYMVMTRYLAKDLVYRMPALFRYFSLKVCQCKYAISTYQISGSLDDDQNLLKINW